MLNAPPATKTGTRDRTIMILMYDSAVRISELLGLKLSCVDLNGKRPLFYTVINGLLEKMSSANVLRMIKKYAEQIRPEHPGILLRIYCHMFRRARATNLYQSGVDMELVSWILGHSSTQTTRIYASPSMEMMKEAMDAASGAIPDDDEEMARLCGLR